jgi:carboxyl-terminal processing protease
MKKKVFFGTALVLAGILISVIINPLISKDNIYDQIEKFQYILSTSVKNYVEEVDTQKLTEAAIKGMLDELDPHSVYIDAEKMKEVREDFSGSFDGIGVQFDIINDTITVISPIAGGPSEELGIQAGDKIVTIDGEDAVGIKRSEVPKKLKGPKGTTVTVDIVRIGMKKPLHFEIIRDKIPLYTVDASFLVDQTDVGVIVINRFAQNTHAEFLEALRDLKSKGMKKLILDLRGNPGGFLSQAFYLSDEFLAANDTIVYTKGRRTEFNEAFISSARGNFQEGPLIVLINHGSASASEIVSGSIQDLDRGLVVGVTSFGKGLVQRQFETGDGSAFRLTISRYYTPSGRSIQRPYDDEKAYRSLVGRLELEEGSNIEHALEKIKTEMKAEEEDGDDDMNAP